MSSSPRNFSLVPTLLLSLALGVILGVFFLLIFNPAVKRSAAAQSGQTLTQVSQTNATSGQSTGGQSSGDQATSGQSSGAQGAGAQSAGAQSVGAQTAQNSSASDRPATSSVPEDPAHGTTQAADPVKGRTYEFFTGQTGAELYVEVCQSCHMPGGKGAQGGGGVYNYPALAGNAKLASAPYVESMVLNGNGGMPGFAHYLSDEQAAKIVNYVRSELNEYPDQVTPDSLKQIRPPENQEMTFGEDAG